jgi:hypothetical protein
MHHLLYSKHKLNCGILFINKNFITMKKANHILILIMLSSVMSSLSCKKSSDSPTTTAIEYRISPMNLYFIQIKYIDNTGNPVIINDPSQFSTGTKSISISTKPFNAILETKINNTTSSTINYTLSISVNGAIKKIVEATAPPIATSVISAEYNVQ